MRIENTILDMEFELRLLDSIRFIPNSNYLDVSNLFDSEINTLRRSEDFRNQLKKQFFSRYQKYLKINIYPGRVVLEWSSNPGLSETIIDLENDSEILLIASYNAGEEYESKLYQVKRLKRDGLKICLGHLYELINYDLPDEENFSCQIYGRLKFWVQNTNIKTFAFHAGLMMQIRLKYYHEALLRFKSTYPDINCLLEPVPWYSVSDSVEVKEFNSNITRIFNLNSDLTSKIWNG